MLYLYQSNQLEKLSGLLAAELMRNPPEPLQQVQVLVQSPGMATWIKTELAQYLGVVSNVEFPLPSTWFWKLHRSLQQLPEKSCWSKDSMGWFIFQKLGEWIEDPICSSLAEYLQNNPGQREEFSLAQKIADVYDQYLVFRPDWIESWSAGKKVAGLEQAQGWQALIWKEMHDDFRKRFPGDLHRAELMDAYRLSKMLQEVPEKELVKALPGRIFVFGISSHPPSQLAALNTLSKWIDIHFFVLSPSQEYWASIQTEKQKIQQKLKQGNLEDLNGQYEGDMVSDGNPLLASFGKQGKEFQHLLLANIDEMRELEAFSDPAEEKMQPGLLAKIQQDILYLNDGRLGIGGSDQQGKQVASFPESPDLQVHITHSPMREVEILHDQLLDLFARIPALQPKDILVMMPDVESYAPYVNAVFGATGKQDVDYIPWSINDQSALGEMPVLGTVKKLLDIQVMRFSSNEVMDLLEVEAVRSRFMIGEEELETLEEWVQKANIRWGINSNQKARIGLPQGEENTWFQGIRSLLLSAIMEEGAVWKETLASVSMNRQQAHLLGRFISFLDCLVSFENKLQGEKSVDQWQEAILWMLDAFFSQENDWQAELELVRRLIDETVAVSNQHEREAKVNIEVVRQSLMPGLEMHQGGHRFLSGAVNFCTLMPMRSVPFKVVCLLGMQDEEYPRKENRAGYDLMKNQRRMGDRSRRDEDRYLFLEALLSCREYMHISYCGRDIRDNSEKPPAVVLADLLDYIKDCYGFSMDDVDGKLVVRHPLQPFNLAYFADFQNKAKASDGENLVSYSSLWGEVAKEEITPGKHGAANRGGKDESISIAEDEIFEELLLAPLGLQDLKRFMLNPAQVFLQKRLGVLKKEGKGLLDEDEAFQIDGLDQWNLLNEQIELLIGDQGEGEECEHGRYELREQWLYSGRLPQTERGVQLFDELWETAKKHISRIEGCLNKPIHENVMKIRHEIAHGNHIVMLNDEIRVNSRKEIQRVIASSCMKRGAKPGQLVELSDAPKLKHLVSAWLEHVCIEASGSLEDMDQGKTSKLYCKDFVCRFDPIGQEKAVSYLGELLTAYAENLVKPLFYMPQTAYALLMENESKATEAFYGNGFMNIEGESEDWYFGRLFGAAGQEDVDSMKSAAKKFWELLYQKTELEEYE